MTDVFEAVCSKLNDAGADYRIMEHAPEGQTEAVSAIRGHTLEQAAKCMMLIVKLGKKRTKFVLAVVRGDAKVDTKKVKAHFGASYVGFAAADVAERLAGSPVGTVVPFAMSDEVKLLVDPDLVAQEEFFFNAGRLDRSIAVPSSQYSALAHPQVLTIAAYPTTG